MDVYVIYDNSRWERQFIFQDLLNTNLEIYNKVIFTNDNLNYSKPSDWERLDIIDDIINNNIFVFSSNKSTYSQILKMVKLLKPIIIIHLSDEYGNKEEYLELQKYTKLLLRQYYHVNYPPHPNVKYLPLGYMNEAFEKNYTNIPLKLPSERKYKWSFVGTLKQDRQLMIDKMSSITPNYSGKIDKSEMINIYRDSIFVPNGRGNHTLDCFRLYEASACGAIVIVVASRKEIEDTFKQEQSPPWLYFRTWDKAQYECSKLLNDFDKLNELSKKHIIWWRDRVLNVHNLVNKAVNNNIHILDIEDNIRALKNNHRDEYKNIAHCYEKDKQYSFNKSIQLKNKRILENALLTTDGLVISHNSILKNGGCECCVDTEQFSTKLYEYRTDNKNKVNSYSNVITLSQMWGSEIWHFPMECLVGLSSVNINNTIIHISKKTSYCMQWCELIGLKDKQIVDGNVYAEKVTLPIMAKCENPSYEQIHWLKKRVSNVIDNSKTRNVMILVKRTKSRTINNFDDLHTLCLVYAELHNLKLYIHDDSNLPCLNDQLQIFSQAKVIIANHGAGCLNIIACKKHTLFIELSLHDINVCYMRLANLLELYYIGMEYNGNVNLDKLRDKLF